MILYTHCASLSQCPLPHQLLREELHQKTTASAKQNDCHLLHRRTSEQRKHPSDALGGEGSEGERRRVEGSGVVGSGDRQATNWRYYLQPRQTLQDYEGFAAVKSEVASGIRTPAGQLGSLSM